MVDTACLVRANRDPILRKVMEDWWKEVRDRTFRDQLSFGYICWKNKYEFDLCELYVYDNPYLKVKAHENQ